MSIKINKNGKEYDLGFVPQSLYDDVEELKGKIKKKSYTFSSFTENCMVTDLNTADCVIIGIRTTNREGWNLIARNGASGLTFSNVWVITEASGVTLSGTFNVDVYYI